MLKKHFHPYRLIITKAINSCTTAEQLHCCGDMLHRFKEHFEKMMPDEYAEAAELLGVLYLQKQHEINP